MANTSKDRIRARFRAINSRSLSNLCAFISSRRIRESNVSETLVSLGTRRDRTRTSLPPSARARANLTAGSQGRPPANPGSIRRLSRMTSRVAASIAPTWQGFIFSLSLSLSLSLSPSLCRGWRSSLVSLSVLNGAVPARREEKKARDSEWLLRAAARHWNARILGTRNDLPPRPVIGQSRRDAAVCKSNAAI